MPPLAAVDDASKILCEVRQITQEFSLPNGHPLRVLEGVSAALNPATRTV